MLSLRHALTDGRAFVIRGTILVFLFNIPSTCCITQTVSFVQTSDHAAILRELGRHGRFTFIWLKMVVSSLTLLTIQVGLLQIPRFSEGSLETLLLMLSIALAFNSLMTSIVYCCYAYHAIHDKHAVSWKQTARDFGVRVLSIMLCLPFTNLLWALLLLCLSFAASYACGPNLCLRISNGLSHIAGVGAPLLVAGIFICYSLHGSVVAYILRRYHITLNSQSPPQVLEETPA